MKDERRLPLGCEESQRQVVASHNPKSTIFVHDEYSRYTLIFSLILEISSVPIHANL